MRIKQGLWKTYPVSMVMLLSTVGFLLCHVPFVGRPDGFYAWRHELTLFSGIQLIVLMSLGMLLGMRPLWLERLLGGLDKMYRLHRRLGIACAVMLSIHWSLHLLPGWLLGLGWISTVQHHAPRQGFPWHALAGQAGLWAAWAVLVLVTLSLLRRLPYRPWRKLHKLFPVVYLALVFHTLILLPQALWLTPLGGVLALLMLAACWSALVSLRRQVGSLQRYSGTITHLQPLPGAMLEVRCQVPDWKGHVPGQFALVSFHAEEGAHPYTIACAWQGKGVLRFVIKALGDYTTHLPQQLKIGDSLHLEGPYGGFTGALDGQPLAGPQVWVAAGVGVTPFLAWLQSMWQPLSVPVDLFYCVRQTGEAAGLAEMQGYCQSLGIRLHVLESSQGQRLEAAALPQASDVWFCGPQGLGVKLQQQLAARSNPPRFHHEAFSLR